MEQGGNGLLPDEGRAIRQLHRLGDELYKVAKLAERIPESERPDTLPRVRVVPMGRTVESAKRHLADLSDLYDPESVISSFYKPMPELISMYYVPTRESGGGSWAMAPRPHRLQLLENIRPGGKITLRECHVAAGKSLHDFADTQEYRRSRFYETTGSWSPRGISPDDYEEWMMRPLREHGFNFGEPGDGSASDRGPVTEGMDQEFIPIMGGPYHKNLTLYAHWEQTAKAFYEKNHSEIARAAISITSDFVLGRGIAWKIRQLRAREIWEEFWDRNNMAEWIRRWSDDLVWQGELMVRKFEEPRGFLSVRAIDPSSVWEIITVPDDITRVLYYHLQWPTVMQGNFGSLRGQPVNVPMSRYIIEQYPAPEVHHVKLNISSHEKWGRSDFYSSFATLKRHRDWINAATLKDLLQANLIWKIKVHGDQGDIDAFVADPENMKLPSSGGTWVENDALELSPMHQDMMPGARTGMGATGEFLTSLFATAMQMPVAYFNTASGGMARATALTAAEPFVKRVATRQQVLRLLLDHLYETAMRMAVDAGRIAADAIRHEDADPEWIFPSTYEEDRGAKFRDLVTAKGMGAISHRTLATQMGQELGLPEYDYKEERKMIDEEGRDQFLQLWPPHAGGPASAIGGSYPTGPVPPQLGQAQQPGAGADLPPELLAQLGLDGASGNGGKPTGQNLNIGLPGPTPENATDEPQNVEGTREKLKGGDARARFGNQQGGRVTGVRRPGRIESEAPGRRRHSRKPKRRESVRPGRPSAWMRGFDEALGA